MADVKSGHPLPKRLSKALLHFLRAYHDRMDAIRTANATNAKAAGIAAQLYPADWTGNAKLKR